MDMRTFAMGAKSSPGGGVGLTNADRQTLNAASENAATSLSLVNGLLSTLPLGVYKYLISASGHIWVDATCGVIDQIKVSSQYAGQTVFVARCSPVYVTDGTVVDPNPQIQSAVVDSDGSVSAEINLFRDNYYIVVTTADVTAVITDRGTPVSLTPMLFTCRYTRRTNELLDGAGFPEVSEMEYAEALGYRLGFEAITEDDPDDVYLNTKNTVYMCDGTNYYEVRSKPSGISPNAPFFAATYTRL